MYVYAKSVQAKLQGQLRYENFEVQNNFRRWLDKIRIA
jgi:hypothetical protein